MVGATFSLLRLVRAAVWSRRLARSGSTAPERLERSTRLFTARLGLGAATAVRLSSDVPVPSVVGPFAPTVLIPPHTLDDLDPGEMEAILAHELSHVRRRDLLANAAQRLVGAVLFFHPVVGWISRAIDCDRELCCDGLVARIGVSRRVYARALARLALHARPAPGLGASDGDVAARVRRLMSHGWTTTPPQMAFASVALLAATILFTAATTGALLPSTARAASEAPAWESRVLTAVRGSYTVNATDPAGEFTVSVEDGRVVEATVGGRPLTVGSIHQRGAWVTLQPGVTSEHFAVTLLPSQGIAWAPRPPSDRLTPPALQD
jgi:hypothetical protein